MSQAEAMKLSGYANSEPSPRMVTRLGRFVLFGLILLVTAFLTWLINTRQGQDGQVVLFFQDSVNGLLKGAPVKLNGVPIGHVESTCLRLPHDVDDAVYAEVHITLRGRTLHTKGIPPRFAELPILKTEVARGLRGKLAILSPMTGTFYVELGYQPDVPSTLVSLPWEKLPEIPVVPRLISSEKLTTYADNLLEFSQFDIKALEREWNTVLDTALRQTNPAHARSLNATILERLQKAHILLSDARLIEKCHKLNQDMEQLRKITSLNGAALETALKEGTEKLASLRLSLSNIQAHIAEFATLLDPKEPALGVLCLQLLEAIEWIETFRARIPSPESQYIPR